MDNVVAEKYFNLQNASVVLVALSGGFKLGDNICLAKDKKEK